MFFIIHRVSDSGYKRTWQQVKIKHKNIVQSGIITVYQCWKVTFIFYINIVPSSQILLKMLIFHIKQNIISQNRMYCYKLPNYPKIIKMSPSST